MSRIAIPERMAVKSVWIIRCGVCVADEEFAHDVVSGFQPRGGDETVKGGVVAPNKRAFGDWVRCEYADTFNRARPGKGADE